MTLSVTLHNENARVCIAIHTIMYRHLGVSIITNFNKEDQINYGKIYVFDEGDPWSTGLASSVNIYIFYSMCQLFGGKKMTKIQLELSTTL